MGRWRVRYLYGDSDACLDRSVASGDYAMGQSIEVEASGEAAARISARKRMMELHPGDIKWERGATEVGATIDADAAIWAAGTVDGSMR